MQFESRRIIIYLMADLGLCKLPSCFQRRNR